METMARTTARLLPRAAHGGLADLRALSAHTAAFGPLPVLPAPSLGEVGPLAAEVEIAGLRGRGGGWFPTAVKLRAVATSVGERRGLANARRPFVIANAMEGEPAAHKDAVLISHAPHLVLDGIVAAAATIGAKQAYIAVHRGSPLVAIIDAALAQRHDAVKIELITPPARYVASEESALAHWAGDGVATPVYGRRPFESGMRGRPTLILNAETMAHLALIARNGGAWFATVGDPAAPGTTLVSVSGAVRHHGVIEVPTGTPVREILELAGGLSSAVNGFLTGGYGGAWVAADALMDARWSPDGLRDIGGVIGAGILIAMPADTCAVRDIARIAHWMAGESAGQCGPCRFGLPAVASDLDALAADRSSPQALVETQRRLALISNRGGCKHPDGVARFVATGLTVFDAEVRAHQEGRCTATEHGHVLTAPHLRNSPVARPGKDLR